MCVTIIKPRSQGKTSERMWMIVPCSRFFVPPCASRTAEARNGPSHAKTRVLPVQGCMRGATAQHFATDRFLERVVE